MSSVHDHAPHELWITGNPEADHAAEHQRERAAARDGAGPAVSLTTEKSDALKMASVALPYLNGMGRAEPSDLRPVRLLWTRSEAGPASWGSPATRRATLCWRCSSAWSSTNGRGSKEPLDETGP